MSDLISREDALKNYQTICKGVACADCQMRYDDGECKLERFLRAAPTIKAEPVKHGRWILNRQGNWACSLCGNDPYHSNMHNMNYCPNCGARMDGKNE